MSCRLAEVFSMLKKLDCCLNIIMVLVVIWFIGHGIYAFWDYKTHPDLYVVQSAPWYIGIYIYGIVTLILLAVLVIAKLIIWKKLK